MSSPSAFILFDEPVKLSPSAISLLLDKRYPGQSILSSGEDGDSRATLLNFSGVMVALLEVDLPLPDGWQSAANRAAIYWPEAETVFDRHRAHVAISTIGDSNDRLHIARVVAAVVGAVIAAYPQSSAVLWDLAVANSSAVFEELSRSAFSPYPDFPSALWVSMNPFRDEDGRRVGAVTTGLKNFVGREIEFEGSAPKLGSMLTMERNLATYLLQKGLILRDGDTIGLSETDRIQVRFKDSERFAGLPVVAAVLSDR